MDTMYHFFDKLGWIIVQRTYEHLVLCFFSVLIAVAIALPLGILLTRCRWPRLADGVMLAAATIQTIPTLALIALIMLLFAVLPLQAIGTVPATVALVLYALLPVLRNTYTGIRQVDSTLIEVARGLGMRPRQILLAVELPLSLPVIMAGIRISTVWTIGIATLASLIGAGGLGDLIFIGLRTIKIDYLLAGTLPAAGMAIVFDGVLVRAERWLTPEGVRE